MRRYPSGGSLQRDPGLLRYDPRRTYVFYMPGVRARGFVYAFLILGVPGVLFLASYRGGVPGPNDILALILLVIVVAGLTAQYFANRVFLTSEEIVIRKEHHDFTVSLWDIEDVYIADSLDEVEAVHLPPGHYPMEFETHDSGIVVLVLRDGIYSNSSAERLNGILTKTVSFNVARPERFLSYLKMRV